ncbi:hypothetical protein GPECTOR_17g952 [Gonium pectorale]|uniref:Uncharacterized protein n=1 Tax=Gonium pectorale TaxID=33097 RepID=A0A150GKE3_GONPE|nr:hypothetical protein GPECTOR_17g952 [Gonium pectorale]|eukprot:KXZ50313.1 hypothetical protein GPECTOR_17g952 [Gonium pectorale]
MPAVSIFPPEELQRVALFVGPRSTHRSHSLRSDGSCGANVGPERAGGSAATGGCGPCDHQPVTRWDALGTVYCLGVQTTATATLYLVAVYWGCFAAGWTKDPGVGYSASQPYMYVKHLLNLVVVLLEVLLTRVPFVSVHYQVVLLYSTAYSACLWAYGESTGEWRYGLNWHKTYNIVACAILPLGLYTSFYLWYLISVGRERLSAHLASPPTAAAPSHEQPTVALVASDRLRSDLPA